MTLFRSTQPRGFVLAGTILLLAPGCGGPPADVAARKAEARARLETLAGPFPTAPAGGEAGARLRETAAALAVETASRSPLRRLAREAVVARWQAEDRAVLEALLAERAPAIAALDAAAAAEPAGLGLAVPLPEETFPDLRPLLDAARLLALDGRLALEQGDRPRAAARAATLQRLQYATRAEPWLITQLIAGGLERNSMELLADALARADAATTSVFGAGLARLDSLPPLGWIAGEASLIEPRFAHPGENTARKIEKLDPEFADVAAATLYARYAELATAVSAGPAAYRDWWSRTERESNERRRWAEKHWWRLAFSPQRAARNADAIADLLFESVAEAVGKDIASRPSRQLARLAIRLASGPLPAALPEVAGFEEVPVYALRSDGMATVSLPAARDDWQRRFSQPETLPTRFEFLIAPAR